jgi:ABC-type nitrate/sulfonate/bicarbonate transport system substrate-binding protein
VTTPEYLAKHGDVVEKLLGAQMRVTHGLATHPEQYSADLDAAIGKLAGKRLPEGVVANSLKYVKFTDEPLEQTFTQMGEWAFDLKMLSQRPQLEGLFDLTALHKLEKMFSPATTQAAEDARVGS